VESDVMDVVLHHDVEEVGPDEPVFPAPHGEAGSVVQVDEGRLSFALKKGLANRFGSHGIMILPIAPAS
jgi:hypothetical protein